ncbi:hypothetical protein AB6A40_002298 [Gnathostoma spinigerum]|uniref:Uncharacterized protein n=1 Tax=Gnathostoma spinigerum TaxID=75299 RepID=A0ABD6EE04_9BILA
MVLFSCSTIRNDVNQLLSEVSSYFKETAVDNAKNTHKSSSSKKLRLLSMRKDVRKLYEVFKAGQNLFILA